MKTNYSNSLAGVILAAGKGARTNLSHINKVLLHYHGHALIDYPVKLLKTLKIPVYVVVGYKKEEVKKYLGNKVFYIEQKEQAGTGGAVLSCLTNLSGKTRNLLVMFGDHAFFYIPHLIKKLISLHQKTRAAVTVLTVTTNNPVGYGRVIRNAKKQITAIVEEKNLTGEQNTIKEIVTGLYCFQVGFLRKYKDKLRHHTTTGEYYLSDYIALANQYGKKVSEVKSKDEKLSWGVNTLTDLERIERKTI